MLAVGTGDWINFFIVHVRKIHPHGFIALFIVADFLANNLIL